ncbi:MAG TPA: hypothetical protein VJP59_04990 [Gemmatimonadota bacterium]|nr:hypothetical protein [Gemmatimonadota bacterium]
MKATIVLRAAVLLPVLLLGARTSQAQVGDLRAARSMEWSFTSLQATATSVPLRLGSGADARDVNTGPITIGGSGRGSIDSSRKTGPASWQVSASAAGLQELGVGSLSLNFVGTAVLDGDCLFVVDVAGIGGSGAQGPVPQLPPIIIINCNKPNGDCSPSIPQPAPSREPGRGKAVKFGSPTAADFKTYPVANMITEAARMAGLSLTSKHVDLVMRQYQQQPGMELVILDLETGRTSSSNLEGGGTLEFVSR